VAADGVGQGLKERRRAPDPAGQGGAVEVDALALEHLALAVEGQVVAVLRHQDVGEEAGTRPASLDRARGQWRLHEALAARAGEPRTHDAVHDEAARHVLELFGDVLPQAPQVATAAGTGVLAGRNLDGHARDVVRERTSPRMALLLGPVLGQPQLAHEGGGGHLARLQGQLELLGRLRRHPEPMGAKPG
jgi:hypothetical protein